MMVDDRQDNAAARRFDSKAAFYAGLLAGGLFFFISRGGNPWASFGWPTHVMGRPFPEGLDATAFIMRTGLQLVFSVVYSYVVAAVIFKLKPALAVGVGALMGLPLYGLNYLLFQFAPASAAGHEATALFTHLAFCMIVAGAYKGFSIERPAEAKSA